MNDNRAAAQELPGQVLAAARKGQERVTKSVKNMTTNFSSLPTPAQLREKAPDFMAKLPSRLPARLQPKANGLANRLPNRLPSPEQLLTSAQEFAGHARSVQRLVAEQVRSVATPLAHQAAARLAQVGTKATAAKAGAESGTTTKVSGVTVTNRSSEPSTPTKSTKTGATSKPASTSKPGSTAKPASTAKPTGAKPGSTTKPKTNPADK